MTSSENEMTATEYMTAVMNERLHMSGERDQIKNILLEDLRTHGWTETMFKAATKATAVHNAENETVVGTGSANSFQTLTAHQLADLISKPAHENVPDHVRVRLLQKLVLLVREFVTEDDSQTLISKKEFNVTKQT